MSGEEAQLTEIRNKIAFGLDCKVWMESPLGRYMLQRAKEGKAGALEALAEVDAEDPKAIRELQNEIMCATHFEQWLREVVAEGEEAERVFIESQE